MRFSIQLHFFFNPVDEANVPGMIMVNDHTMVCREITIPLQPKRTHLTFETHYGMKLQRHVVAETAGVLRINRLFKQIQMLHITVVLMVFLYYVGHQHSSKHSLHLSVQSDLNLQRDF